MGVVGSGVATSKGLIGELESIGHSIFFQRGERVIAEGELGEGIYILRSGSARVSMKSHEGKVIHLRELERGSFVGLSSTLSCDHCCYTVETADASEFVFIPAPEAQEFLRSRPDLCLQVIQLLGHEMSGLCNERALLNAGVRPVQVTT